MENEANEREFDQESETNISVSSRSSSSCGGKSLQSTAKNLRDRYVLALQMGPRILMWLFLLYCLILFIKQNINHRSVNFSCTIQ